MKNWIEKYGKTSVKKFQQGGPMAPPAEGGAPAAPAPQADQGMEVEAMLAEYAQTRDPQLAVAICDILVELMAGAGEQGGAPPAGPEGAPMGRNGMKLATGPVFKK
jgi:hypothetical protein